MATTLPLDAEVHMVQWINTYRVMGLPVSSVMLHRKALSIAKDMGIPRNVFTASRGWATEFLRRHHLGFRAKTQQGQIKPDDADAALDAFNAQVKQKMVELGVGVVYRGG
ncbi:DNA binding [Phytophthora ramorum]